MSHTSPHQPVHLDDGRIEELILGVLEHRGTQTAITDLGTGVSLSGHEMIDRIGTASRRLTAAGMVPGDVVSIVGPGSADWLIGTLAALAAGLTVMPLNPAVPPEATTPRLDSTGVRAVVTAAEVAPWAREAAAGRPVLPLTGEGGPPTSEEAARPATDAVSRPDDTAFLLSSSGTTGLPKLAMVGHRAMVGMARLVGEALDVTADDVMLLAMPLFHSGGLSVAFMGLAAGARLAVQPTFNPQDFVAAIESEQVTMTVIVPPVVHALNHHPAVSEHDVSSLRLVISTAAPLDAGSQVRLSERLGCDVGQGLGMTEALPITLGGGRFPPVPGSSGRAVPNTELRLVDPETGADVIDRDAVGELLVRGPQLMSGYLDDPAATATALSGDGWLRTGDLCRIDGDGEVFVVDRLKELIKVSGHQVAPAELEVLLRACPGVVDAAVIGRPDDRRGEVPVAFVVPARALEENTLIDTVAEQTPPYARLAEVRFVDEIPRSPTGKILRRVLASSAASSDAPSAVALG